MTSTEGIDRLNRLCDAINEAGPPLDVGQLSASLFLLDLDVTPRRDAAGPPAFVPPQVTVAALFEHAATAVDQGQHTAALALLEVVAAETGGFPLLSAYRALAVLLTHFARAGIGSVAAADVESDLRQRVFDLLTRGPDAPTIDALAQF